MATLIPEVPISEFRKLKTDQLKKLKSCEVTSDGEYLFTFLNGTLEASGFITTQAEYLGQSSNSVGGKTLEEIIEVIPVL